MRGCHIRDSSSCVMVPLPSKKCGAILMPRSSNSDREAAVNTCERCGADAVDARGVCQNCGWQRRGNAFTDTAGAPSLGETRAADVMPMGAPQGAFPSSANQPQRGATSGTGVGQFCGTC